MAHAATSSPRPVGRSVGVFAFVLLVVAAGNGCTNRSRASRFQPGSAGGGGVVIVNAGTVRGTVRGGTGGGGGAGTAGVGGAGGESSDSRAWAEWPMPNPVDTALPHPQSYDVATAGVVVDRVTGLIWQRVAASDLLLWRDADAACANLTFGGRDDWRLPSLIELVSIVDFGRTTPAVDVAAFSDRAGGNFWTSSPFAGSTEEALYVAFSTGFSYHGHRAALSLQARCVRGPDRAAPPTPVAHYAFPTAATVLDNATGLTWQRVADTTPYSWTDAGAHCRELALEGGGWRVPSMKELQTLLDVNRPMPTLDPMAFPGASPDDHWTSSPLAGSTTDAWYVSFRLALAGTIDRGNLNWVRCVR